MKIFLLAESVKSIRENGETIRKEIDKSNTFRDNLTKSLKKCDNFLFICNNPKYHESHLKSANMIFEALKEAGLPFKNCDVLDGENYNQAESLVKNADLIFLAGGKLKCQLKFFKKIGLKELLLESNAVVLGVSAGAMNLGEIGYNYPENRREVIFNKKYLSGLGFYDFVIIPHFVEESGNLYCPKNVNLLKKYYLPDSQNQTFYALPNGSYILVDDKECRLYGEVYKIEKGEVVRICENEESKVFKNN